jgi:probable HAF family extracellular repeat protein
VGWSFTSSDFQPHAFVYSTGVMTDLSQYLSNIGITGESFANAINDDGDIVGDGVEADGSTQAFLLVPVPEPSTWSVFALGSLGFLRRTLHRSRAA